MTTQVLKAQLYDHLKLHRYIYLLLATLILSNLGVFRDLIYDWAHDDNYSHGFLIIPIAVWLFYRKRDELSFPSAPGRMGIVVVLAGCAALLFGIAAREYFTTRAAVVLIVTGLGLYYLGYQNFRKVWFSFFFLLFMIPIPAVIYYQATLPMQMLATKVTVFLLQFIGVACAHKGNIIELPGYSLEVVEACSGLRSLVTLMALAALYAYLNLDGKVRPLVLFFASIPIAIVTNIVRVFVTAVGAYAISPAVAENFLHEISGMLVFVTALICTVTLGALLKWRKKPS